MQMHYGPTPFKYMHFSARQQKYKLVSPHDFPHGIVHQPTDHVLENVLKNLELYHMENDPSERINIAKQHPDIVDKLLEEYENWLLRAIMAVNLKRVYRVKWLSIYAFAHK